MFRIVYWITFEPQVAHEYNDICREFVSFIHTIYPKHANKLKVYLLRLIDNMLDFGHPCFNTERYIPSYYAFILALSQYE